MDNLFIKHLTTYPFFLPVYFKTLYTISLCLFGSLISRLITLLSGNYNFFISFLSFQLKDFIYLSNLVHLLHFHCYFLWPNCHILFLEYCNYIWAGLFCIHLFSFLFPTPSIPQTVAIVIFIQVESFALCLNMTFH